MMMAEEKRSFGENPVTVPLCRLKMPHELAGGSNGGLRSDRLATSRLNHGTVQNLIVNPLIKKCCRFDFRSKVTDPSNELTIQISMIHFLAVSQRKMFRTNGLEKKKTQRSALFWDFMLRRMVVSYRLFGTTYRSSLQGSSNPRRNRHDKRYVSVHFLASEIMEKGGGDSKRTFPSFLLNSSKQFRTETYPSPHAKNKIALASFRLS